MWLMLQQDQPHDFVIGTGTSHSVREFADLAFQYLDLDWQEFVEVDPLYYRPNEVNHLLADAGKARKALGWQQKTEFADLIRLMVDAELAALDDTKAPEDRDFDRR